MRKVWKVCSAAYHHFTHHALSKSLEWIGWFLRPSHPTRCTHARQKLCLLIRSDNHCFWDVANPFPYVCSRSEKLPMQTTNYHAPCCIVIIRIKLAQFSARANQEGSLEHSRSGSCNEDGQSLVLRCCKPLSSCMWQVWEACFATHHHPAIIPNISLCPNRRNKFANFFARASQEGSLEHRKCHIKV